MAFAQESGGGFFFFLLFFCQKGKEIDRFLPACSVIFTPDSSSELECPVDLIIQMSLQTALIRESSAA